jgi:hypothetical protein
MCSFRATTVYIVPHVSAPRNRVRLRAYPDIPSRSIHDSSGVPQYFLTTSLIAEGHGKPLRRDLVRMLRATPRSGPLMRMALCETSRVSDGADLLLQQVGASVLARANSLPRACCLYWHEGAGATSCARRLFHSRRVELHPRPHPRGAVPRCSAASPSCAACELRRLSRRAPSSGTEYRQRVLTPPKER